jgi:hypothetical protein
MSSHRGRSLSVSVYVHATILLVLGVVVMQAMLASRVYAIADAINRRGANLKGKLQPQPPPSPSTLVSDQLRSEVFTIYQVMHSKNEISYYDPPDNNNKMYRLGRATGRISSSSARSSSLELIIKEFDYVISLIREEAVKSALRENPAIYLVGAIDDFRCFDEFKDAETRGVESWQSTRKVRDTPGFTSAMFSENGEILKILGFISENFQTCYGVAYLLPSHEFFHFIHYQGLNLDQKNELMNIYNTYNRPNDYYKTDTYTFHNVLEFFAVLASVYCGMDIINQDDMDKDRIRAYMPKMYTFLESLFLDSDLTESPFCEQCKTHPCCTVNREPRRSKEIKKKTSSSLSTFDDFFLSGKINLKEYVVKGDGNCFFRAIAHQVEGDQNKHAKYRQKLCDYIDTNKEYLGELFYQLDPEAPEIDFDAEPIRRDGSWYGLLYEHLYIMSIVINRPLLIYEICTNTNNNTKYLHPTKIEPSIISPDGSPVYLCYYADSHYNSVVKLTPNDLALA